MRTNVERDSLALSEAARCQSNLRQRLLRSQSVGHRGQAIRDIGLGVACGVAALGIAAGTWIGTDRYGDANGALAADATKRGTEPAGDTIIVRVTAYGSLRSAIGGPSAQVSVPLGTTVAVLAERLADQYPGLAPMAMLAVNGGNEMLPLNSLVSDGQLVELIPPLSGG